MKHKEKSDFLLKNHDDRFSLLNRNASDVLVVIDLQGIQRFVSPEVEKLTGFSSMELVNRHFSEVIHPEDLRYVMRIWNEGLVSSTRLMTANYRHIHKFKEWVQVEAVGQNFINEPSLHGVVVSVREFNLPASLSPQKKEIGLQQINEKINEAINTSGDPETLFDLVRRELGTIMDTRNFYIAELDEMNGLITAPYQKDEFNAIPRTWSAENSLTGFVIRHKRSLLIHKDEISALAEAGEIVLRGRRAEAWLGVPIKSGDKVVSAIVVQSYDNPNAYSKIHLDLLESVAARISRYFKKQNSTENESRFSKALVHSPVSILITDLKGRIEYVNPKLCESTGYSESELIGKNPRIFNSGYTSREIYQQLWNTISIGGEWRGEIQNRKKSGEIFWESVTITPIFDASGVMCNYIAVKEDITDRKNAIVALEDAKQKAEAGDRLKSAFLENISHEIRTPLNGILGFAPLVLDPNVSQKDKEEYLAILYASGKRLMQTVNDYMDISLLVSGNMKATFRSVHLKKFIDEQSIVFSDRCRQKNLDFIVCFDPGVINLSIRSDRELLRKVLFHLIDNAVKFTEHGSISIECTSEEHKLKISIIDTGIGIEFSAISNIFEKFFQEEHDRTRNFEGSGLGLTIVAEIMKLLGGSVSVTSRKFKGSKFTLSLPF